MTGNRNAAEARLVSDHWFDVRRDSTSSAERVNNEASWGAIELCELSARGARHLTAQRNERGIIDHRRAPGEAVRLSLGGGGESMVDFEAKEPAQRDSRENQL